MIHGSYQSLDRGERRRKERTILHVRFFYRLFLTFFLPLCIIGIGIYYFFFSRVFSIDTVALQVQGIGEEQVKAVVFQQMDESYFKIFSQRNIFFFSISEVQKKMKEHFALESFVLSKKYPNKLTGSVQGMPFSAFLFVQNKIYALHPNGTVIREFNPLSLPLVPQALKDHFPDLLKGHSIVTEKSRDDVKKKIPLFLIDEKDVSSEIVNSPISQEHLKSIQTLFDSLRSNGFIPLFASFKVSEEGIRIQMQEGFELKMSLEDSGDSQIRKVLTLLETQLKNDKKKVTMIDTRFGSKVYYTFK